MGSYQFIDTQMVSCAFQGGQNVKIRHSTISSIVASEFLLVQSNNPKKANYYIPRLYTYIGDDLSISKIPYQRPNKRGQPVSKNRTDSVTMEFGLDHEPIIEFSNTALANIINNKYAGTFYTSIQHLEKDKQQILRQRFQFLLANELKCVPLSKDILDLAFLLLEEFTEQHNIKQDFRNIWNNILILATALAFDGELITKDNELNRFASEQYAQSFNRMERSIYLSFTKNKISQWKSKREKKEYINRGWKAKFQR